MLCRIDLYNVPDLFKNLTVVLEHIGIDHGAAGGAPLETDVDLIHLLIRGKERIQQILVGRLLLDAVSDRQIGVVPTGLGFYDPGQIV